MAPAVQAAPVPVVLPQADPARPDPVTRAPVPVVRPQTDRAPADPITRADPVVPADPITRADPAVPVDPITRADPVVPVAPADPITRADPVVPVAPVVLAHGMGIPNVATSTGPRGATDLGPGDPVRHRDRLGTDRSRRPGASG